MQMYTTHSVNLREMTTFSEEDILGKCQEIEMYHEEEMDRKLKKDKEKRSKLRSTQVVSVGLLLPEETSETEIHRENQWFEDEMRSRDELRQRQLEQEDREAVEAKDLDVKEQQLEDLKLQWQQKMEEIKLEETELERIQKEFDEKLEIELRSRMDSSSSSAAPASQISSRLQEAAERKAIKKAMKQANGQNPEEQARCKMLNNIEEKNQLEKDIVRMQKEVGLIRQRIRGREKSANLNMIDERKRRVEDGQPKVQMSLEELYAPRKHAPRPFIPKATDSRLEEARLAKEARRAKKTAAAEVASREGGATC